MSSNEDIALVRDFIARTRSAVSEGDVAAGTGLDVGSTKAALHVLMRSHRCTLQVHEDGTLVYDFGGELVSLSRKSLRERVAGIGRWLWKGFSFLYKASLAVLLVAYAVVFVVLLIAAAIAASTAAKDEGPAEGAFHLVGAIFRGIFEFVTYTPLIYGETDRFGYPHGHYEPKAPVLFKKQDHNKGFVASVYDFVLGPKRVEPGPMAQRQEVAAFVRKNRGVLTVRDVQALSGLSRGDAEAFFARFVAEQDGVAEITENGALYATFEELLRSESTEYDAPIELYWDEYEAPVELTGNTGTKNALIALLAGFNLAGAFTVMSMATQFGELGMWLGAVPAVLFTLFFALPVLRAPVVWWKNRLQHANNIRKRLFRAVFGARDEQLTSADVVERANENAFTEEKLRVADIEELLGETMHDIGGELDVSERGETITDFTRLRIEEQVVEEHALEVEAESEVVFRTAD
ncbi:MAG: hypothetical protein ACI9KE_004294 [Polyangiales bacterium]|jgi:hypothetical protein